MNNYSNYQQTYQNHIDGIRALAVVVVWLFHLNPYLFPGGYIGVDIFFVVSGYVITLSILNDIKKEKRFRFLHFYKKRFFRIFPALFFVIFFIFLFYLFFGYLFELNYVSKIAFASLLGLSNIFYIYLKSDYFLENELNPFLHTWSLGVEEQFYFLYPILIIFLIFSSSIFTKIKFVSFLRLICLTIILLSFFCFFSYGNKTIGNFYSPLARFWEIVFGCLLYLVFENKKIKINPIILSLLIISFILIIFFDNYINNIYITLIFAVLFTAIIITSNNNFLDKINNIYISYLGKISYSLYLWHLPVLYFSKIYFQGILFILVNILLVLSLSFLSYNYVEQVFRYNRLAQKIFLISLATFIFLFFLFVFYDFRTNNNLNYKSYYNHKVLNITQNIKNLNLFENKFKLSSRTKWDININNQRLHKCEYSHSTFKPGAGVDRNCLINNSFENIFIINGDSHATHYYPMIESLNLKKSMYLKTYEGCMFVPDIYVIGKELYKNRTFKDFDNCQTYISDQIKNIQSLDNDFTNTYLILSSRYTAYIEYSYLTNEDKEIFDLKKIYKLIFESLDSLASELREINIILISPLPEFKYFPFSCFLNNELCKINIAKDLNRIKNIDTILNKLADKHKNILIFNPHNKICEIENNTCSMYNTKSDILYFKDRDHLTIEGSEYLGIHFEQFINENIRTFN